MDFLYEVQKMKTQSPGVIAVSGVVVTSTSGTVASSNIWGGGASIAKTAAKTGRYTLTLAPPVNAANLTPLANLVFMGGFASLLLTDDTAAANSKGVIPFFRRDDISATSPVGSSAKDGTIELQWTLATGTAQADTDVQDGAAFFFTVFVGTPDKT